MGKKVSKRLEFTSDGEEVQVTQQVEEEEENHDNGGKDEETEVQQVDQNLSSISLGDLGSEPVEEVSLDLEPNKQDDQENTKTIANEIQLQQEKQVRTTSHKKKSKKKKLKQKEKILEGNEEVSLDIEPNRQDEGNNTTTAKEIELQREKQVTISHEGNYTATAKEIERQREKQVTTSHEGNNTTTAKEIERQREKQVSTSHEIKRKKKRVKKIEGMSEVNRETIQEDVNSKENNRTSVEDIVLLGEEIEVGKRRKRKHQETCSTSTSKFAQKFSPEDSAIILTALFEFGYKLGSVEFCRKAHDSLQKLSFPASQNQVYEKVRTLRKSYFRRLTPKKVKGKEKIDREDEVVYELSEQVWGEEAKALVAKARRAVLEFVQASDKLLPMLSIFEDEDEEDYDDDMKESLLKLRVWMDSRCDNS